MLSSQQQNTLHLTEQMEEILAVLALGDQSFAERLESAWVLLVTLRDEVATEMPGSDFIARVDRMQQDMRWWLGLKAGDKVTEEVGRSLGNQIICLYRDSIS
jgi:hypothetical protein